MRYACITLHGTAELETTLAEYAAADWRLHTLTYLGTIVDHGTTYSSWHVVMEKGI